MNKMTIVLLVLVGIFIFINLLHFLGVWDLYTW